MRKTYIVCYDVADPKRWREVHKMMLGHGEPLQLSVFLCELSRIERERLVGRLKLAMNRSEDALAIVAVPDRDDDERPAIETYGVVRWQNGRRIVV